MATGRGGSPVGCRPAPSATSSAKRRPSALGRVGPRSRRPSVQRGRHRDDREEQQQHTGHDPVPGIRVHASRLTAPSQRPPGEGLVPARLARRPAVRQVAADEAHLGHLPGRALDGFERRHVRPQVRPVGSIRSPAAAACPCERHVRVEGAVPARRLVPRPGRPGTAGSGRRALGQPPQLGDAAGRARPQGRGAEPAAAAGTARSARPRAPAARRAREARRRRPPRGRRA